MSAFWICVLAALAVLERLRRLDRQTTVIRGQFRLYALRDELREHVMNGEIDCKDWVFQYLDSSIAKTINVLEHLTIWKAIAILEMHRDDERLAKASFHLKQELDKPQNKTLAQIHNEYADSLISFFLERHPTTRALTWNVFLAVEFGKRLKIKWRELAEKQTETPETSTLGEFVPA